MIPGWGLREACEEPGILWDVCNRWRIYALDQRMIKLGFPSKLVPKTFGTYVTETGDLSEALDDIKGWARDYRYFQTIGKGILMTGNPGIGKTHLAVAACRWLMERHVINEPRFWDYTHLMTVLRAHNEDSEVAVAQAMHCELLVLDDLNTQRVTDWVREQLGMIVNHRWSNNLITIVTSNDILQTYAEALGSRIVSRIEDMCPAMEWDGRDWRVAHDVN
jgi:DNA replication protein DnaC